MSTALSVPSTWEIDGRTHGLSRANLVCYVASNVLESPEEYSEVLARLRGLTNTDTFSRERSTALRQLPLQAVAAELLLCLFAFLQALVTSIGALQFLEVLVALLQPLVDDGVRCALAFPERRLVLPSPAESPPREVTTTAPFSLQMVAGTELVLPPFLSKDAVQAALQSSCNCDAWSTATEHTLLSWVPTGTCPDEYPMVIVASSDRAEELGYPTSDVVAADDPIVTLIERACGAYGLPDFTVEVSAALPGAIVLAKSGVGVISDSTGFVCIVLTELKRPFLGVWVHGQFYE